MADGWAGDLDSIPCISNDHRLAAAIADGSPNTTILSGSPLHLQYSVVQKELKPLRYRECDTQTRPWPSCLLSCIHVEKDLFRVVFAKDCP